MRTTVIAKHCATYFAAFKIDELHMFVMGHLYNLTCNGEYIRNTIKMEQKPSSNFTPVLRITVAKLTIAIQSPAEHLSVLRCTKRVSFSEFDRLYRVVVGANADWCGEKRILFITSA